jgi:hypothetical protein
MPYNPIDWYGPLKVQPDHGIIYEGLKSMGQGLASGINSAGQYIGQERSNEKDRAFRQSMQEDHQANQREMMDIGFGQQLQLYGMQQTDAKAAKAEERQIKADELLNYGRGRAASVVALAEVSGSPMAKTMAETLGKITDGKALADTSDAFLKAILTEHENNQPDQISEVPVNGGRNTAILRNGKLFNVLGGEVNEPVLTPEQIQSYGAAFPNAAVTARLPGGVTITQKPPQDTQPKLNVRNIPGPMVPDPAMPGRMIQGPDIPVKVNPDGTYEQLQPKSGTKGGQGYGDNLFKIK